MCKILSDRGWELDRINFTLGPGWGGRGWRGAKLVLTGRIALPFFTSFVALRRPQGISDHPDTGRTQGRHRGNQSRSRSRGLHEPTRGLDLVLPKEPRSLEEQAPRPQGHRQRLQEPNRRPDQEPRAVAAQS